MCGIAGTIYKKDFHKGKRVLVHELEAILNSVKNNKADVDCLLDACWNYKSNENFLRYCKDIDERRRIESLCKRIERLCDKYYREVTFNNKRNSHGQIVRKCDEHEKLLDCHWFLSFEMKNWMNKIKYYTDRELENLNDSSIIFYKQLNTIINSIDNRLEIRGRDSLGVGIQLYLTDFNRNHLNSYSSADNSEVVFYEEIENDRLFTFIFKTAASIGSLGDNAKRIKTMIKQNKLFNELIENNYTKFATIVAHTRWASVGEVNINNCHPISNQNFISKVKCPLILASLNGDIYNYKELNQRNAKILNLDIGKSITTDCLAIPISLIGHDKFALNTIKDVFNAYEGSFAIALQCSEIPGEIILSKRGSQGLYLGLSQDGIYFASDVYGLVETCQYFYPINSGSILSISQESSTYKSDLKIKSITMNQNRTHFISNNELRTTNITTRDIDKKDYDHFLVKEIYETSDITRKTILSYLQEREKVNLDTFNNAIIIDEKQVPEFIIDRLKSGKIKEIVITGMGTCYTAAVAISRYMREMLRYYFVDINIEPHIASEGSAFYLKPKMDDTLVIVIAQSGTTVDTNVYLQMAKERGALSLALANKREGDVTFIVDGTLYISNGRDIEIAVPSTKTYTAQVILGYILTLYFCSRINSDPRKITLIENNLNLLRNVPDVIDETFNYLDSPEVFKSMWDFPLRNNCWYLVYDNSPNSVCAMEIRIKLSEGCYHSIPCLHVEEILERRVENAFIVFMSNEKLENIEQRIIKLLERDNVLTVITCYEVLTEELISFQKKNKISFINIPRVETYFSFIPTVIAGQLLSYYCAVALDERKDTIRNLYDAIISEENIENRWNELRSKIREGYFNQGFSIIHVNELNRLYLGFKDHNFTNLSGYRNELLNQLEELEEIARRPIDTIKHQAKTITVGALRGTVDRIYDNNFTDDEFQLEKLYQDDMSLNFDELFKCDEKKNSFDENFKLIENYSEIDIYPVDIDESYGYNVVNIFNNISDRFGLDIKAKLSHHYDLPNNIDIEKESSKFWIFLTRNGVKPDCKLIQSFSRNRYIAYNLSGSVQDGLSIPVPVIYPTDEPSVNNSFGSIYVACNIAGMLLKRSKRSIKEYFQNDLRQLKYAWQYLNISEQLDDEIQYAARTILSKNNWKCLGSGVNYNIAKFAAKNIISRLKRTCAFDVLENHKHIDISAESGIIIFLANIYKQGYQNDAFSEIEKFLSHNNLPIVITNLGDNRFHEILIKVDYGDQKKNMLSVPVIKLPKVNNIFSMPVNICCLNKIIDSIVRINNQKERNLYTQIALNKPSEMEI